MLSWQVAGCAYVEAHRPSELPSEKLTVPEIVPGSGEVTVAVHPEGDEPSSVLPEQAMVVVVPPTRMEPELPVLAEWVESPGYEELIEAVPGTVGVQVTVQDPEVDSEHVVGEKAPYEVPWFDHDKVPVGVSEPVRVSVTVAVQLAEAPIGIAAGLQTTEVDERSKAVMAMVPELGAAVLSPP